MSDDGTTIVGFADGLRGPASPDGLGAGGGRGLTALRWRGTGAPEVLTNPVNAVNAAGVSYQDWRGTYATSCGPDGNTVGGAGAVSKRWFWDEPWFQTTWAVSWDGSGLVTRLGEHPTRYLSTETVAIGINFQWTVGVTVYAQNPDNVFDWMFPPGTRINGCSADGTWVAGHSFLGSTVQRGMVVHVVGSDNNHFIDPLPGQIDADMAAVSDNGAVAGGRSGTRPVRWTAAGGLVDLAVPPPPRGLTSGSVRVVRGDGGALFGWYRDAGGQARAFVWTAESGMFDLHDDVIARGTQASGWRFTDVVGVSLNDRVLAVTAFPPGSTVSIPVRLDYPLEEPGSSFDAVYFNSCPADLGRQGGTRGRDGALDNNDFIVYIDLFFGAVARADVGRQGGVPGRDGQYDNNDFIVFIDQFFAGCQ